MNDFPEEARVLHAKLGRRIREYLDPSLGSDYDHFLQAISAYLWPAEIKRTKNVFDVLSRLEAKGKYGVGNYTTLKSVISDINVSVLDIINEFESQINDILGKSNKNIIESKSPVNHATASVTHPSGTYQTASKKMSGSKRLTEQDLQRMSSCFGAGWDMLMGQLGLNSATVDQKKMEAPDHVPTQIYKCLQTWANSKKCATLTDLDRVVQESCMELGICTINTDRYNKIKTDIEKRVR